MNNDQNNLNGSTQKEQSYKLFLSYMAASQKRIYGFIYALIPNHTLAEDIMQETMLAMWESFNRFQEGKSFSAWGIGIARNKVKQYSQKQKRHALTFDSQAIERLIDQSDVFEDNDNIDALRRCYKKLNESDQKLLVKRYIEGCHVKEIALNVNLSTSRLYRIYARILKSLHKCIKVHFTS